VVASVISALRPPLSEAQSKRIKLAYCSQLLCGVPYEVARSAGIFKGHGLAVEIIYTRGGQSAMQALVGGAVDYAATALDVAIQAYANVHADIRRFAVTGRLPLFAVVTAPRTASQIRALKDLEGKSFAISPGQAQWYLMPAFSRINNIDFKSIKIQETAPALQPAGGARACRP